MGIDNPAPSQIVTTVFGLTKAQLWPIVQAAAGERVASFDIAIEHEVQGNYGCQGEKAIPTFTYTSPSGRTRAVSIFGKYFYRTGPAESQQYAFLEKHSAPIPRMFGALYDPDGREMLFLEYVDSSPEAQADRTLHQLRDQCVLLARFNGITPSRDYRAWLEDCGEGVIHSVASAEGTLERLWERAVRRELGESLRRFCADEVGKLCHLQRLARDVAVRAAQMESGLLHTDFARENTGRRRETGELLLLDIEFVGLGPRFFDIGCLLGPRVSSARAQARRRVLSQHYLEAYARAGGAPPPLSDFDQQTHVLALAGLLRSLAW